MIFRTLTAVALLMASTVPVATFASETQTVASSPAQAANPDDKIRCRRIAITGSLIKAEKVCKTVSEWRNLSDRGNDRAREYVGTGQVCAGGDCGHGN